MSLLCFLMPLFSKRAAAFEDAENDGGAAMLEYFVSVQEVEKSKSNDGRGGDAQAYRKLKQLLAPFCLRRRKDECLSQIMPGKTRVVLKVPFDAAGKKIYDSIIKNHVEAKEKGNIVDNAANQNHLFTSLRKAANHPLLLRTRHTNEEAIEHIVHHTNTYGYWGNVETAKDKKELIRRELARFSDFDLHSMACDLIQENPLRAKEMERYKLAQEDLFCSPKFVKLRTLIPLLIKEGHRMLIFSQWKMCLDLLDCLLDSMGLRRLRIDGSTEVKERQSLMDQFNESDIPVFLLSTRAGGMGINLTGADTCILHDLDFNPFNDLQAEDRCHRIGQTKPVTVFKMVTQDTVDSAIHDMQEQKKKMNAAIIGDGGESAKEQQKQDAEAVHSMVQSAVSRFFATSPEAKGKMSTSKNGGASDTSDSDDFL
jgi:SWI/SNF-related matrix-associated actin-dependent regulator 1 of chromatin subfamily A